MPAPQVSEEQAEQILREHYGLRARAKSLGSQQDRNFTVTSVEGADDGAIVGVLKIANPAFNETELHAQDLAADLIAAAEPDLRVAVPLPNVAGEKCTTITGLVDGTRIRQTAAVSPGRDAARCGLPVAHRGGRSRRGGGSGEPGTRRIHASRVGPDPAMGSTPRRRRCRRTAFTRFGSQRAGPRSRRRRRRRGLASRRWPRTCRGRRCILISPMRTWWCRETVAVSAPTGSSTSGT